MNLLRQLDIFVPDETLKVTVIGAGGIGSWVALGLSKMGFKQIEVWDGDKEVEAHNVPNQLFFNDTENNKAEELSKLVQNVIAIPKFWDSEQINADIIVMAVDNMDTRKRIIETQRASFIIDGRIGGEIIRVLSVSMLDLGSKKYYLDTWYPSPEGAEQIPCTARAIIDVGFFVAGIICNRIRKFLKDGIIFREVIFDADTLDIMKIIKED